VPEVVAEQPSQIRGEGCVASNQPFAKRPIGDSGYELGYAAASLLKLREKEKQNGNNRRIAIRNNGKGKLSQRQPHLSRPPI